MLDACLNFAGKAVINDPVGYLRELFMAGKMNELEAEAKKITSDPMYRYINFETQFNDAGYRLMGNNQVKEAVYIFGLVTKLYPQSANAWDSFAEANWKAGNKDKAIEYYNKAISLDPNGETGNNARRMLEEMKKSN